MRQLIIKIARTDGVANHKIVADGLVILENLTQNQIFLLLTLCWVMGPEY